VNGSLNGKDANDDNSLFNRPIVDLLDEKQLSYLQKRYHMSPRELQVAKLVCQGFNEEEIAKDLNLKHGTLKTHLRNVYRRVRVRNKITLLLRLVEDAAAFSAKSKITPPIPIVDIEKPRKKTSAPAKVPGKEK